MRVFRTSGYLELVKNISAFFDLEAGVGRGPVTGSGKSELLGRAQQQVSEREKQLSQTRRQLDRQKQQLDRQKQQLEKRNEQLAVRGNRIEMLQNEILQMREGASGDGGLLETREPAGNGGERPGIGLKPGDPHYRSWVGQPEQYDLKAAIQVSLLLAGGLRETHKLVEVGCGSLRAARMFIPYLLPGNYHGIEPNRWVVEEGIRNELGESILEVKRPNFRFVDDFSADGFGVEFDYALAQSVFSHTYPEMTLAGLKGMSKALAPTGRIFANFVEGGETSEDGEGWVYPGCTTHTWERMGEIFEECNLVGRKLSWMQGMQWFVAARPDHEDEIDSFARRLRPPLEGISNRTVLE